MIKLSLPIPPSVNALYGGGSRQRRFKSKEYKAWEKACPRLDAHQIGTPVYVNYLFWFRDKRERDLSNFIKGCEDFMVKEGVLADDNHKIIARFSAEFAGIDNLNPRVEITIYPLTD